MTHGTSNYGHILIALPRGIIASVIDFIRDARFTNKYQELDGILIERNFLSENTGLDQILPYRGIGERKPSEFYRTLLVLGGSNF